VSRASLDLATLVWRVVSVADIYVIERDWYWFYVKIPEEVFKT